VEKARNDLSAAVPKFCLALEDTAEPPMAECARHKSFCGVLFLRREDLYRSGLQAPPQRSSGADHRCMGSARHKVRTSRQ